MNAVRLIPVLVSMLLLAAHFSRADNGPLVVLNLMFPLILLLRRPWVVRATQVVLCIAGIEWVRTLVAIAGRRQAAGEAWIRMAVILGAVAAFTVGSVLVFRTKGLRKRYGTWEEGGGRREPAAGSR